MDKIRQAIEDNGILKVIYHGGSQPGSVREIVPRSIKANKLRAHCLTSDADKTFIIDKIEIIDGDRQGIAEYDSELAYQGPQYEAVDDLLADKKEFLENLGWVIKSGEEKYQLAESFEQHCETLELYSRFKNGNLRKTADVRLSFAALTWDDRYEISDDSSVAATGDMENIRKRVRPWSVWAKKKESRSYGSLDKASRLFLELAESLKPQ